ncbi:protoporphyrinogen/coproporphyrinogen oxidase [Amnibacterium endophyticum]|uniref:Protoporphyrinogen/coproporphyrinogen oxidase n=1 Tax=Amnibacterium endophyticum TaxID=2109337 RepID=A0ABW4LBE6_9MICO
MTAVVVGGGVAGLVAARRLLQQGERVVLLEASDRLGGRVHSVELGGVRLDSGAESFAVRGGAVRALVDDLGLGADVVDPTGSAWVALADREVPLPAGGLLGIPSSPLATDVARVVGTGGSLRAYADRVVPLLKVGRYEHLGPLVRRRMGRRVLDRLVTPVVQGVYGVHPDDAPVDAIAPGLNAAITNTGALSAAVLRLRAAAPPGAAAQGLVGGVHRLVEALAASLAAADVRLGTPVLGIHPAPHGPGFQVVTAQEDLWAHRVVLAADGGAALDLLADAAHGVSAMPRPEPAVSTAVLLVADDGRLDAAPRGTGVLVAPERTDVQAVAVTHATAKWAWLAGRLPPHRHVLRVAYRGPSAPDDAVVRRDLAKLLGVPVGGIRARADVVWRDPAPALAAETIAIRRALDRAALPDGLTVAGAWTAGTGLASVVASGERAAARG